MSIEMYRLKVLNNLDMPYLLGGIRPITEILLVDEKDSRDPYWTTMDGSLRIIGAGQGKWYNQPTLKTIVLLDDTGSLTVGSFEYQRWVLRKWDVGPIRFKHHEFQYLVVYDR